jgi:hypothetical protein
MTLNFNLTPGSLTCPANIQKANMILGAMIEAIYEYITKVPTSHNLLLRLGGLKFVRDITRAQPKFSQRWWLEVIMLQRGSLFTLPDFLCN